MKACLAILIVGVAYAQVAPLHVTGTRPDAQAISILSVAFQELKFGHEGPDFFSVKHAPYRGKRAVAKVTLHGQEAIRTVQFELLDQFGIVLESLVALRTGDEADADEYLLQFEVPVQPFRFGIKGEDVRGQVYERIDRQLFTPVEGDPPPLALPPGWSAAETAQIQRALDNYAVEMQRQFESAKKAHPDGVIPLLRSEVLEAGYEPLRSPAGRDIGLRLHFTVRFGADGNYSVAPNLFPQYKNVDWREITLKVLDARATPAPKNTAADTLDDVLRYGGAARYDGGRTYKFEFDLTPTYVIRNVDKTRFCVYSEQFRYGSRMDVWQAVQNSDASVKYRVAITSLDFQAETGDLPPQRTYIENFRREGAADCGPAPTNRF